MPAHTGNEDTCLAHREDQNLRQPTGRPRWLTASCPTQARQGLGIDLSAPPFEGLVSKLCLKRPLHIDIQLLPHASHERHSPKDGIFKNIPSYDSEEQGFVHWYPYSVRPRNVFGLYSDHRATHRILKVEGRYLSTLLGLKQEDKGAIPEYCTPPISQVMQTLNITFHNRLSWPIVEFNLGQKFYPRAAKSLPVNYARWPVFAI